MDIEFWSENLKGDLGLDGNIMLKYIVKEWSLNSLIELVQESPQTFMISRNEDFIVELNMLTLTF
jgi:hypothetical protein